MTSEAMHGGRRTNQGADGDRKDRQCPSAGQTEAQGPKRRDKISH